MDDFDFDDHDSQVWEMQKQYDSEYDAYLESIAEEEYCLWLENQIKDNYEDWVLDQQEDGTNGPFTIEMFEQWLIDDAVSRAESMYDRE